MIEPQITTMKDKFGKWRTYSLFYEHRIDTYKYYWTLHDQDKEIDGVTIPSLKQIYLGYDHIPGFEYHFATEVIGSWIHWKRLCRSGIKGQIAEWRAELDIKLNADSLKTIIKCSINGEGASKLQAARYLADKGYSPIRGRPSKEEKEGLLNREAAVDEEIQDDLERVGLKRIK